MAKKSSGSVFVKAHTRIGKKVRAYMRGLSSAGKTTKPKSAPQLSKSREALRTFVESRKGANALRENVRSGSKDSRRIQPRLATLINSSSPKAREIGMNRLASIKRNKNK